MSETPAHRRAKRRAAGPGGRTEVPLRGISALMRCPKGGRATEVESVVVSSAGLNSAAQRLKKSGAPGKVLPVPQQDMGGAVKAMRKAGVSGTVKNMAARNAGVFVRKEVVLRPGCLLERYVTRGCPVDLVGA